MDGPSAEQRIRERLAELTSHRGGQADMVAFTGSSDDVVSRYVTGKRQPPHDFLLRVAEAYGVSLDWLYGRTKEPAGFVWHRSRRQAQLADEIVQRWSEAPAPPWARELTAEITSTVRETLSGDELLSRVVRGVREAEERLAPGGGIPQLPDAEGHASRAGRSERHTRRRRS